MSFFSFSESDLDAATPIIFNTKEVVEMVCLDYNEGKQGNLALNCKILTGEKAGKPYTVFIDNREHPMSQKLRTQFALAFWTREELIGGTFMPAKLVNRKFSVVAQEPREHEGKTFQNVSNFRDLGEFTAADVPPDTMVNSDGNPKF